MKKITGLVLVGIALAARGAETNFVFHDDFESASTLCPPSGWTRWGNQQHNTAADFVCDTNNAHGGRVCFRIHHPANSAGYIVSSPQRAIHPQHAMTYAVTFWARADKPGESEFKWVAYRTINPFEDWTAPGAFAFNADNKWKEYTFSLREGLDFFADQSQFLMLMFTAATKAKEERTLWIDDVRVTEQPDPHPAGLLNDAAIPHAALQHRLQPGDRLEFTVDPTKRLRRAMHDVGGVSFHRVCGWTGQPYNKRGDYTLAPEVESAIREMRLPMTRFYAVGDEPFGLESGLDRVAEMCRRVGVPQGRCVVEFEEQGARTKLPPEAWARGVRYALQQGYKFHHWEIANEPYSSLWGQGQAFSSAEDFSEHFKAVSRAIRVADPAAQLGLDIHQDDVHWGNYLLKQLAGDYDFVAPHYYCSANVRKLPFEEIALSENFRKLDRASRVNALLHAYNPQRDVYQYDTEWGMICNTPDGKEGDYECRNANIIGTLHRAVRLIYYAREDILRGASGWQMLNKLDAPGFGIVSQEAPDKRFLLYWLYYYFNRHVGEWALAMDGTAPYYQSQQKDAGGILNGPLTPVLATLSQDGREMYLVIANGSWSRAVPCRVHVQNFAVGQARGVVLTNDKLDGNPLLEKKEDAISAWPITAMADGVACTIPPHAVVFMTLTPR